MSRANRSAAFRVMHSLLYGSVYLCIKFQGIAAAATNVGSTSALNRQSRSR